MIAPAGRPTSGWPAGCPPRPGRMGGRTPSNGRKSCAVREKIMRTSALIATGLLALLATPASAATFLFSFAGSGQAGSGTLTTDDITFASRGYTAQTITGVTGTYNGSAITGLMPGLFGANNLYYVTGPSFLDGSGLGFRTTAGNQVNLFYQDSAPSYRVNTLNPFTSAFVTAASTPAVPEPATWAMMIAGFGAVGVALRRRAAAVRGTVFA